MNEKSSEDLKERQKEERQERKNEERVKKERKRRKRNIYIHINRKKARKIEHREKQRNEKKD